MERYFLGNNTGYGFYNCYDNELKGMDKVVLLKGGPGTGKSSLLKRVASFAKEHGLDCELWYCSGDPQSLDGVYIKDKNRAVIDATSPHAINADLPVARDIIFDVANGLDREKLSSVRDDIEKLIKRKKTMFMHTYQHLKCALCHFDNQIEGQKGHVDESGIRAYCATLLQRLGMINSDGRKRKLFTHAICPSGESVYYDHLKDKSIMLVEGGALAKKIFFDEMDKLVRGITLFLKPLSPNVIEGCSLDKYAFVDNVGPYEKNVCECINLDKFQDGIDEDWDVQEDNARVLEEAFGVDCLNKARQIHLKLEDIFVSAMDFSGHEEIYKKIIDIVFD